MPPGTYLIGIAGPSGAGKTFLAMHLAAALQAPIVALDRYYRDLSHLTVSQRAAVNFDAPEALEHELLIEQIEHLHRGKSVALPVYDFATHTRQPETQALGPGEIVIVEGLFTLYWPKLRELLGTKVYVDMSDDVCLTRRIERDVRERGRSTESVREQYTVTVAPMANQYVRPTKNHADVKVFGADPIEVGVARVLEHYEQQRVTLRRA